jgi:hypothetical protein
MNHWLHSLQESALAHWAQAAAYPAIITVHSMGLAILVGLLTVINLRVLGFAGELRLASLRRFMPVVWGGFALNAATGMMLFSIDAGKDFHSGLFRVKMLCIALGLLLACLIQQRALRGNAATPSAKIMAGVSLLIWTAAIVSGRLLAYSTFGDE